MPPFLSNLENIQEKKIQSVHKFLSFNARSIESTRGRGKHGLIFIIQEPNTYHTLTSHVPMLSTNIGPTPVMQVGIRASHVISLENSHIKHLRVCKALQTVSKNLMRQLSNAFEPQNLRHLKNSHA